MGAAESQERGLETNEPGIEGYTGWLTSDAWGSDPGADATSQPWFGGPVDQEAVHQAFALVEESPGPRKLGRPRELVFEKPEARKLPGQEAGSAAEGRGALEGHGKGDAFAEVSRGRELPSACTQHLSGWQAHHASTLTFFATGLFIGRERGAGRG